MMRWIIFPLALLFASLMHGQNMCGLQGWNDHTANHAHDVSCSGMGCAGLQGTGLSEITRVPVPHWYIQTPGMRSAIINLEFASGFPELAMPAVEMAVDIWAQSIETALPIDILADWDSLSPSVLAQSSPLQVIHDFDGAPVANRQYALALANQFAGEDLDPANPDMVLTFTEEATWYFGLDGQADSTQYDLVTVALHEIAHGLGYIGSANHNGNSGFFGYQGVPFIYDQFVEFTNSSGITSSILDFTSGTVSLGDALESDALNWGGDNGVAANPGFGRPRLYAPSIWNTGASFSHLREGSFPAGNDNSLMTPFLNKGESIHHPGAIALGMMQDLGWNLPPVLCSLLDITLATQTPCNPVTNTYTQQVVVTYENAPETGNLVVNGLTFAITGSPQTISLTNLTSDGDSVDVTAYFSENPDCALTLPNLFVAPEACCLLLRLHEVNPETKTVTVRNVSNCEGGFSGQFVTSGGVTAALTDLVPVGTTLMADSLLTIQWPNWPDNAEGGDLTLYDQVGAYDDYVQWLTAGNSGQILANLYGLWTPGTFVDGLPPYTYIGDPYASPAERGVSYWEGLPYPCVITDMVVGATSACDPDNGDFTQVLEFSFDYPPDAGTTIQVEESLLTFDGANPWSVELTLPATGNVMDITATVLNDHGCTATFVGAVSSPPSCGCPIDLDGGGFVDVNDLLIFLSDYGCLSGCDSDFDNDDIVGVEDLLIFLSAYGSFCF